MSQDRVIDSHVHFWDASLTRPWLDAQPESLRRDSLPPRYRAVAPDVAEVVAVQADCLPGQSVAEAQWFSALAEAGAPIAAIVAHASLERGRTVRAELDALSALPRVAGVRRLIQDEADGFASSDAMRAGVAELARFGFTMDLCVRQHQLVDVLLLVRSCPTVMFVLDHLGKPVIDARAFDSWAAEIGALADLPNVVIKISGLLTEAAPEHRNAASLAPWIAHAVESFGPERSAFGSDWPLVDTASGIAHWRDIVANVLSGLSPTESADLWHGVAARTYLTRVGGHV